MPVSFDPATAGVASLLKSLRTRAGLREERLTGSESALRELPLVRDLREPGDSDQQAIVRAVSAAAATLDPTYAIVADAVLGLRALGDAVPDHDLYADKLEDRRKALISNWNALHELRSAPSVPQIPTLRVLRLEVETTVLNALAQVLVAGPGQAPPPLISVGVPQSSLIELATSNLSTVQRIFEGVASALRERLISVEGEPSGWRHNLRQPPRHPTPLATAFGLKSMILLEGHLAEDLIPVVRHLRSGASPGGGFLTTAQRATRPEVTAIVMNALHSADGTASLDAELSAIGRDLGDFELSRPYVLATVLEAVIRVRPHSTLAADLVRQLLASRSAYGPYQLWPEKVLDQAFASPEASVVHTARAVRALTQVQAVRATDEVRDAISQAAAWLAGNPDLANVSELIDRPLDQDRVEPQYIRHFTAAWVVKALVSVGFPASHPVVSAALSLLWQSYSDQVHLWVWQNGDLPIWMTYDAIEAIGLSSLAIPIRSVRPNQ